MLPQTLSRRFRPFGLLMSRKHLEPLVTHASLGRIIHLHVACARMQPAPAALICDPCACHLLSRTLQRPSAPTTALSRDTRTWSHQLAARIVGRSAHARATPAELGCARPCRPAVAPMRVMAAQTAFVTAMQDYQIQTAAHASARHAAGLCALEDPHSST